MLSKLIAIILAAHCRCCCCCCYCSSRQRGCLTVLPEMCSILTAQLIGLGPMGVINAVSRDKWDMGCDECFSLVFSGVFAAH